MKPQPTNTQAVVYNINNTNGNNYVNHAITATSHGATIAELPKEHAESKNTDYDAPSQTLYGQNNATRLPVIARPSSNNRTGLDKVQNASKVDHAQPPNNESVAETTPVCDVAQITRREDYILDSDYHSTDKTPAEEDASSETNLKRPQSSTQFRIHVETNQQGVVVLHGGLVPYMKNGLNVEHAKQYWSYYAHILPGNNLGLFPAFTEDNIKDFLHRLTLIRQEVLSIGKATFEAEIVSAFKRSGHTCRGQPITCTKHVEELMRTWEGNVLSCLWLTLMNIHSLNTENSVFLQETLPMALVVHGAKHDPPYTISNETSFKVFGKKRVSNHGLVKLANSACVNVKKRFQELEEKLFGMSVRTKARNRRSGSHEHYEIEINLLGTANVKCKSYILARKTMFKNAHFSDENPPTEQSLRTYLNSGDEVKHLLQAAVSRAKRAGIKRDILLSCIDDCYQEGTSFSNIALPQDLDDLLDLGDSMEGDSSIIDSCLQGRKREQRKEPYEQILQPSQMGQMNTQHHGSSTEGLSSTIDNCFEGRTTVPQGIEPQWQMAHNFQASQYTLTGKPQQVQDQWWAQQHEPQDMSRIGSEQWMKPSLHNQQQPQMELTEMQQQMQLMEKMRERVCLLERQLIKQDAPQKPQQVQQTVMGQATSVDDVLEQSVQQDVSMEQKQQQCPQIPMGQRALLDFFEQSSQRLPAGLQNTKDDDYDDEESSGSQLEQDTSYQMQQQHAVETILHSKFESNGQQKYLIRWIGDFKDSWQPEGNITSDIVDDFIERKSQETANKHLAKV